MPGAKVMGVADLGEAGAASGDDAVTGPAGEFTLKLSPDTRNVHLTVLAPGYATRMLRVPLAAEPVLEIPLEPVGGTLVVDFGGQTLQGLRGLGAGLLAHGGATVPFGILPYWAQMQRAPQPDPHRLILPNMEPGEYVLCLGNEANVAVPRGMEPPADQCVRGYLGPLQELTLKMPPIPELYLKRMRSSQNVL